VIASRGQDGAPQAALIGVAATDQAEIVFDTSRSSRKHRNIAADPRIALVIGLDDEVTVQAEGIADLPRGEELRRCTEAYFAQYPDGRQRATSPDIVHFRVRLTWLRYSDYRPDSFTIEESPIAPPARACLLIGQRRYWTVAARRTPPRKVRAYLSYLVATPRQCLMRPMPRSMVFRSA
jgi:general stress protein 26